MPSPSTKKQSDSAALGALLKDVRGALGIIQADLAKHLLVSPKTVARWENGEGFPDRLQRHGVVATIAQIAPAFHAAAAAALSVPIPTPAVVPAPNMAILKAALDGALFEATETLGMPPQKVREAVVLVLERVVLIGVDAKTAVKLMSGKG
jgi:transcriptional regulator with XRE-family HTH domain